MVNRDARRLSDLFGEPDNALGRLASEARHRSALSDRIKACLPVNLAGQLLSCGLAEDGTLTVLVSAPEWASRLRFESDNMLEAVRRDGYAAARVRIKVYASAASPGQTDGSSTTG